MVNSSAFPEIFRYHEPQRACSYLPDQTAALEYRAFPSLAPAEFEELLRRGWRRMGMHFFRPKCPRCQRCRSIRVDVERFAASKSQRRCLKRNADIEIVVQRPSVTQMHIDLYNAWHADMESRSGWNHRDTTAEEYEQSFLIGPWSFNFESLYFQQGRLVGVGLIDILPTALSSIYFYHDPAWRDSGPGTFTILKELELARRLKRRWLYLGYWIQECQSMAYKNAFRPHEILEQYLGDREEPVWKAPAEDDLDADSGSK
jgi:arginyl-tRNA--protein-N-Asp/Glu arginylyltransferase